MNIPEALPLDLGTVTVANRGSFEIGALYSRKYLHKLLRGGNDQSGITTVRGTNVVLLFSGLSGLKHGYSDFWDTGGSFHYSGEGQSGDMQLTRGNKALASHVRENRRLLLFQMLGHGQVRFLGEFRLLHYYESAGTGNDKKPRKTIMFVLQPLKDLALTHRDASSDKLPLHLPTSGGPTTSFQLQEVRTKQEVFRRRLTTIEAGCRLTSISDLRFLRASHIKPWAAANESERICRENGLLLTPSVDLLFDRGWISFQNNGELLVTPKLPDQVIDRIGLDLTPGRKCGSFSPKQTGFLEYHRDCIYEQSTGLDRVNVF